MPPSINSSEQTSSSPAHSGWGKRVAGAVVVTAVVYFAVSYVLVPEGWRFFVRRHPSFADNPRVTTTGDGHPGDAINVALTATETQLVAIMEAAKWYPADALGVRSDLKIAADTVLKRSYDEAPVSKLFLDGHAEDFAFEQPVGDDPRHRHHVRFWKTPKSDQGRPVWIGAATFDERVGLSHTTGQFTHHTAADIDSERAHVFETLEQTRGLSETYKLPTFHKQREGKNGGGDPWHTDGALWVGVVKEDWGNEQDN